MTDWVVMLASFAKTVQETSTQLKYIAGETVLIFPSIPKLRKGVESGGFLFHILKSSILHERMVYTRDIIKFAAECL